MLELGLHPRIRMLVHWMLENDVEWIESDVCRMHYGWQTATRTSAYQHLDPHNDITPLGNQPLYKAFRDCLPIFCSMLNIVEPWELTTVRIKAFNDRSFLLTIGENVRDFQEAF